VEAIVTENHQAEALRKTKRLGGFIKNLVILTLRDFRNSTLAAWAPLGAAKRVTRSGRSGRVFRSRLASCS
jgi:hypothetical protein